jgi:uncharacterized surface protein with fasciclin (FAS1) repeats
VPLATASGSTATPAGSTVYVNSAKVLKTNVYASNGVIHVINSVLVPSK